MVAQGDLARVSVARFLCCIGEKTLHCNDFPNSTLAFDQAWTSVVNGRDSRALKPGWPRCRHGARATSLLATLVRGKHSQDRNP